MFYDMDVITWTCDLEFVGTLSKETTKKLDEFISYIDDYDYDNDDCGNEYDKYKEYENELNLFSVSYKKNKNKLELIVEENPESTEQDSEYIEEILPEIVKDIVKILKKDGKVNGKLSFEWMDCGRCEHHECLTIQVKNNQVKTKLRNLYKFEEDDF